MTIAVCITVPEGMVFAADSRQTFTNSRGDVRVSSDNARKLFPLGPNILALTFGWAFLMGRNVNSHVNDFRAGLGNEPLPVEEVATRLGQHFTQLYDRHIAEDADRAVAEDNYALAFLVGGYDPGGKAGKLFEVYIPKGEHYRRLDTEDAPGAVWRGQSGAISRLLKGFDPGLLQLEGMTDALKKQIDEGSLGYQINYWSMPVQDAIDLSLFLVDTVIQMQRFADGTHQRPGESVTCGGPIDLAVLEPGAGAVWVQSKRLRGRADTAAGGAAFLRVAET
jgi:hypothetical protein